MLVMYKLLRLVLLPIIKILSLFNSKIRDRIKFEKKINTLKWNERDGHYDYSIEFSSEGELELVKPILIHLLSSGKRVEIIFSSDSVIRQVEKLYEEYKDQIRVLCLPILTYNPFNKYAVSNWITSNRLILVRYDFFPELIDAGRSREFILISGSLKKYNSQKQGFFKERYYNWVYSSFSKILMATDLELKILNKTFKHLNSKKKAFDFRPSQILNRIENKKTKFQTQELTQYINYLSELKKEKIIFGSFWADEGFILDGYQNDKHLCFAPHKLDEDTIVDIQNLLENKNINSYVLSEKSKVQDLEEALKKDSAIIITHKGLLCELYSFFDIAYVAGGFRYSVHSLLEPFLAGCLVCCGPKIERSTEYDIIMDSDSGKNRIEIIDKNSLWKSGHFEKLKSSDLESIDSVINYYKDNFDKYLKWLD